MKYLAAVGVFLLVVLIYVWLFWAGGYNFDHRGEGLVMFSLLSLYCGGVGSYFTVMLWKDK